MNTNANTTTSTNANTNIDTDASYEKTLMRSCIDTIRKQREEAERGSEAMKTFIELRHLAEEFLEGGPGAFRYPTYAQELMPFVSLDRTALPHIRTIVKDEDSGTVRKYLDGIDNRIGMKPVYEYLECGGPAPEDPSPADCADIIHGLTTAVIEWLRRPGHEDLWYAKDAEEWRAPIDRVDVFEDETGGPIFFAVGQAGTAMYALDHEAYDRYKQHCNRNMDIYFHDLLMDRDACLSSMMEDCPGGTLLANLLNFCVAGVAVNGKEIDDVHDAYLACCETCRKVASFSAPGRRDSNLYSTSRMLRLDQAEHVEAIEAIADASGSISIFALNASGEAVLGLYLGKKAYSDLWARLHKAMADGTASFNDLDINFHFGYSMPEAMAPCSGLAVEAHVNAKAAPGARLVGTLSR